MKEILEIHRLEVEAYRDKLSAIGCKRRKINSRISRAKDQLRTLEKIEKRLHKPTNYDVAKALAEKLSAHYNLPHQITGPYGVMKTMGIHLLKTDSNNRMKDEIMYLILRLNDPQGEGWITYYTGNNSGDILNTPCVYPIGHLGAFDETTAEYALLPKDFNSILEIVSCIESAES